MAPRVHNDEVAAAVRGEECNQTPGADDAQVAPSARDGSGSGNRSSRFRGVQKTPQGKFQPKIRLHGKNQTLGTFEVEREAAAQYDRAVLKRDGEAADTNFPIQDYADALREMRDYSPEGYVEKLKNEAGVRKRVAWSVEDDEKMIQAHKDNKTLTETAALLSKRTEKAVKCRWDDAGTRGSPALREYAAQCSEGFASERTPRQRTPRQRTNGWTAEEEKILIEGHKNGKTLKETAFLKFEGKRSYGAVCAHWRRAKQGLTGHAELRAYMEAKFPRDEHERPGGSTSAEGGSGAKGPKPWDFAVIKIFYLGFYRRLLDAIIVDYPPFAQGHIECLMDGHAQLDYAYGVAKQLGLDLDGEKIKWTVKIVVHTASSSQAWHPDRARGLRVLSTVQSGGWKEFKMR